MGGWKEELMDGWVERGIDGWMREGRWMRKRILGMD